MNIGKKTSWQLAAITAAALAAGVAQAHDRDHDGRGYGRDFDGRHYQDWNDSGWRHERGWREHGRHGHGRYDRRWRDESRYYYRPYYGHRWAPPLPPLPPLPGHWHHFP